MSDNLSIPAYCTCVQSISICDTASLSCFHYIGSGVSVKYKVYYDWHLMLWIPWQHQGPYQGNIGLETLAQVAKAELTKGLTASALKSNARNSFLKWIFFFFVFVWYLANWKFVYFLRGLFRKPVDTVNTTSFHAHYLPLDCFRLMSQ